MSERDGMLELVEQRHETFPEVESSEENKWIDTDIICLDIEVILMLTIRGNWLWSVGDTEGAAEGPEGLLLEAIIEGQELGNIDGSYDGKEVGETANKISNKQI